MAVGGKKQPLIDGEECPLGMVKNAPAVRGTVGEVGEMPRR